jgi:hypothetical protein
MPTITLSDAARVQCVDTWRVSGWKLNMRNIVLAIAVPALAVADDQAQKLIDTIVALQAPLEDFRCEFEGIVHVASQTEPGSDVALRERHDAFSGMFLWRKDGDFWCDSFHEDAQAPRKIERMTVVVRNRDDHAEEHRRFDDAIEGQRMFGSPSIFRTRLDLEGPQGLLLLEDLRDQPPNEVHTVSVRDDQIDGRALKVLEIRVKGINRLLRRYWIDLGRNGHVVRLEVYWTGERLRLRRDIKLAKFGLAGAQIWMPVSAEQVTYFPPSASETGESQPESNATISIVNGTTAFNSNLDAKKFAIDYRAGKPSSASARRRSDQFDRQTLASERIDAAAQKARKTLPAEEAREDPRPKADILPESQSTLRYVIYGLGVVAVIALLRVWARRRLRERDL